MKARSTSSNTLRSVNDTSLSDWQGVIGEELEEQQEEKSEREAEVREALARMEHLVAFQMSNLELGRESTKNVRDEVEALRRDLRTALSNTSSVAVPLPRISKKRQDVESHCPACGEPLSYKQWPRKSSVKGVTCGKCQTDLVGKYEEGKGHYLLIRKPVDEQVTCVSCGHQLTVSLDPIPGKAATVNCVGCSTQLRVARSGQSIIARPIIPSPTPSVPAARITVTPEIVDQVEAALPPQPWPQGTHQIVAAKLGIGVPLVRRAMEKLIQDGRAFVQHDGRIYAPVNPDGHPN